MSRIDTPKPLARLAAGTVAVAGVAWAQHRGIDEVEVRVDGGAWTEARLAERRLHRHLAPVGLRMGRRARAATPSRSARPTAPEQSKPRRRATNPFPSGATGWHSRRRHGRLTVTHQPAGRMAGPEAHGPITQRVTDKESTREDSELAPEPSVGSSSPAPSSPPARGSGASTAPSHGARVDGPAVDGPESMARRVDGLRAGSAAMMDGAVRRRPARASRPTVPAASTAWPRTRSPRRPRNNPVLSTLVTAVTAAGLGDTLNSAEDITVFAPANDAFAAMDKATLDAAMADPKGLLTKVLTYHVVPGRLTPETLAGTHETLAGRHGHGRPAAVTDFKVNGTAKVVCGNVQTANATVYIIDGVLLPPAS